MIKLEDYDVRLLERVSNKLDLLIDTKIIDDEYYIKNDDLLSVIDELYDRIGDLEEQIEDIEQDRDDNYRPISIEQQI